MGQDMPNSRNTRPTAEPGSASVTESADGGHAPRRRGAVPIVTWGSTLLLLTVTVTVIATGRLRRKPALVPPPKELVNVEVVTVRTEEYRETLILPARLEADRHGVISSELSGRLETWTVPENARVKVGEQVAALNTDTLTAELARLRAHHASTLQEAVVAQRQERSEQLALEQSEQELTALQIDLESAEATRKLATRDCERIRTLAASGIATAAELDAAEDRQTQARLGVGKVKESMNRARIAVQTAQARLEQAGAAQDLARSRVEESTQDIAARNVALEKTRLCSPVPGTVEEYLVEAGEVVTPGLPLAHVYDLEFVRAVVDVADRYVPFLDADNPTLREYIALAMPGAEQDVRTRLVVPGLPKLTGGTYDGLDLQAEIVRIGQSADPASNTFKVELRMPNPGRALKQGMICEARIDYLRYPEALIIPLRAVQVADVGPRVLVVTATGNRDVVAVRDIEPVAIQLDRLLIRQGVRPGDRLIVAGGKGVLHGEEVRVLVADGVLQAPDAAEPPVAAAN